MENKACLESMSSAEGPMCHWKGLESGTDRSQKLDVSRRRRRQRSTMQKKFPPFTWCCKAHGSADIIHCNNFHGATNPAGSLSIWVRQSFGIKTLAGSRSPAIFTSLIYIQKMNSSEKAFEKLRVLGAVLGVYI